MSSTSSSIPDRTTRKCRVAPHTASPESTESSTQPNFQPNSSETGKFAHKPESNIPGYEILEVIGRGGMGIVYKARQTGLNRIVALKMIITGVHADEEERQRFLREAEAAAQLQHPNIVPIYDIGQHNGAPYFSLEYVNGGTLQQFIDPRHSPEFIAGIVEQLALAIQHAHERGIVHRDLKPGNILISRGESQNLPVVAAVPQDRGSGEIPLLKITDFGLAKKLDSSLQLTATGCVAGTPAYMAPEQIKGAGVNALSPSVDVYSLGAILYELLAGRPPFLGLTALQVMSRAVDEEPAPPSVFQPGIPKDLQTICLKCLQKSPSHRYASAADLAFDLGRFREGKPIHARPVGRLEQLWRWSRRNPTVALLVSSLFVVLFSGVIAASHFAIQANDRRQSAERSQAEARHNEEEAIAQSVIAQAQTTIAQTQTKLATERENDAKKANAEKDALLDQLGNELHTSRIRLSYAAYERGEISHMRAVLQRMVPAYPKDDRRGFEWFFLDRLSRPPIKDYSVYRAGGFDISPDGKLMAAGGFKKLLIYSLETGTQQELPFPLSSNSSSLQIDGATDSLFVMNGKEIHHWSISRKELVQRINVDSPHLFGFRLAPSGTQLAIFHSDRLEHPQLNWLTVFDLTTNKVKNKIHSIGFPSQGHCFSADEREFVAAYGYSRVAALSLETGKVVREYAIPRIPGEPEGIVSAIAVSPDGKWVAGANQRGQIAIWDYATTTLVHLLMQQGERIDSIAFNSRSDTLAVGSHSGSIKLYSPRTGECIRSLRGLEGGISKLQFVPGKDQLVAVGGKFQIFAWALNEGSDLYRTITIKERLSDVQWSQDGKSIDVMSQRGNVYRCDLGTRQPQPVTAPLPVNNEMFFGVTRTLNGDYVAALVERKEVRLYRDGKKENARTLDLPKGSVPMVLRFSPDGKTLAIFFADRKVGLYPVEGAKEPRYFKTNEGIPSKPDIQFTRDGRYLAAGVSDMTVWDLTTGAKLGDFGVKEDPVCGCCFSPDGRWLVTGHRDGHIELFDVHLNKHVRRFQGVTSSVIAFAFSPRGDRLVTGGHDGMVRIWDTASGEELLAFREHNAPIYAVLFAPDGSSLITADLMGTVRHWQTQVAHFPEPRESTALTLNMENLRIARGNSIEIIFDLVNRSGRPFQALPEWHDSAPRCLFRVSWSPAEKPAGNPSGTFTFDVDANHQWSESQTRIISKTLPKNSFPNAGKYRIVVSQMNPANGTPLVTLESQVDVKSK